MTKTIKKKTMTFTKNSTKMYLPYFVSTKRHNAERVRIRKWQRMANYKYTEKKQKY